MNEYCMVGLRVVSCSYDFNTCEIFCFFTKTNLYIEFIPSRYWCKCHAIPHSPLTLRTLWPHPPLDEPSILSQCSIESFALGKLSQASSRNNRTSRYFLVRWFRIAGYRRLFKHSFGHLAKILTEPSAWPRKFLVRINNARLSVIVGVVMKMRRWT